MNSSHLRVLTLNVWGLKYLSKRRLERIAAICDELKHSDYDIICFQELWADYDTVKLALRPSFPHSKYWRTAALGSGLAVFSKLAIVASNIFPFSLNGCPSDLAGDWFAGKACASVVVVHPVLGEVEVFNTHFFARGGEEGPEHQRAVRIANAWEMSKLIRASLAGGRHVIVTGDFNSSPHSLPMKMFFSFLEDAWKATHPVPPTSPIGLSNPVNAQRAMDAFGLTVDSPLNTWSHGKPLDAFARRWLGKRLDYILFQSPTFGTRPSLKVQQTKIVLTERVPGYDFSYSDHFGLEATFAFDSPSESDHRSTGQVARVDTGGGGMSKQGQLSETDLLTALGALSFEYREARRRATRHFVYFGGCLALLLLFIVGSAWVHSNSRWVAPLSTILGAVATWWGTTSLYVGFIYGRWETGILENLMNEIEEIRRHIPIQAREDM
ncbi:DNase I-like protein [Serendipita vermifera]|nr:DNase I-like protein [Serendipita vermifera]